MERTNGIGRGRTGRENSRGEVKKTVVEFEEGDEFGIEATRGKRREAEMRVKMREKRRLEFRSNFEDIALDRLKGVRKGGGGRVPDN